MLKMLLQINERIAPGVEFDDSVVLPFDLRQKSRLRVQLESGLEAALLLPRGTILRGGDRLRSGDGRIVVVVAADEPVLDVTARDAQQLMRAVYHLANRHVPLQIGAGWIRIEQDHVLKDMLVGLGMEASELAAPFEPEAGAYGGGHRGHGHAHDHGALAHRHALEHDGHGHEHAHEH
jgi:urease accessory protein